ncbi:hypothetical protein GY26_15980 [Gammaproteobacteria bacterium MFB021]|nr:hypothetical protein GY26_15980 [Gammaproteobacteria bacterium MFB021]
MKLLKTVQVIFVAVAMSHGIPAMSDMTKSDRKDCSNKSLIAEKIMESRQKGVPMREMMDIAGDDKLMQLMVTSAFDEPRFSTDKMQRKSITDFGNKIYGYCVEAKSKK